MLSWFVLTLPRRTIPAPPSPVATSCSCGKYTSATRNLAAAVVVMVVLAYAEDEDDLEGAGPSISSRRGRLWGPSLSRFYLIDFIFQCMLGLGF